MHPVVQALDNLYHGLFGGGAHSETPAQPTQQQAAQPPQQAGGTFGAMDQQHQAHVQGLAQLIQALGPARQQPLQPSYLNSVKPSYLNAPRQVLPQMPLQPRLPQQQQPSYLNQSSYLNQR